MADDSETPGLPEHPDDEDLAKAPTELLVERLLAELQIRHEHDLFILFLKRPTDGGVATIFSRLVGDAYAVEGALGMLHRHARRMNDRSAAPFRGDTWHDGPHEAEPIPGSDE